MKKILFILILTIFVTNIFAFTITEKGKAKAIIVLSKDATESEKFAAEEFAKYIKEISGATLTISEKATKGNNIYIGQTQAVKNKTKGFDWNTLKDDGILWKSGKDYLILAGDRPSGSIYAVYTFLDEILGVKILTDKIEIVPNNKTITVKEDINKKYVPPFMSREIYSKQFIAKPANNAKQKLNGFFFRADTNGIIKDKDPKYGGNVDLLLWVHSFRILLNPKNYPDHPEYFAYFNGQRHPELGSRVQICLSNPNVVNEVTKNVLKELENHPNTKIISVSQNDTESKCECDNCHALYEKYGNSGAILTLVNHVADAVKEKYPNTLVETLSYNWTMEAPKNIKPRDNVIIRLCTSLNDHAHAIDYEKTNGDFYKSLTEWSKISKNLYIWDYVINFYCSFIVHPNFANLQKNIKLYRDNNVKAIFYQDDWANENICMGLLRQYLMAKLLWNPDIDLDKEKDIFLKNYYGDGAEGMNEFIEAISKAAAKETEPPIFMSMYSRYNSFFTSEDFINCFTALNKARDAVKDNPVYLDRVLCDYYSFQTTLLYTPANINESVKDLLEYKTKYDFGKMFYDFALIHGNTHYSEGVLLEDSDINMAKKVHHAGTPPECANISDEEWLDFQENDFIYPAGTIVAKVVEDINSSNGCAAMVMSDSKEWGMQKEIRKIYTDDRFKTADLYMTYRVEGGKTNDPAYFVGVYNMDKKTTPLYFAVNGNDTPNEKYITKKIGTLDLRENANSRIFVCGGDYPDSSKALYIDRIFVIFNS